MQINIIYIYILNIIYIYIYIINIPTLTIHSHPESLLPKFPTEAPGRLQHIHIGPQRLVLPLHRGHRPGRPVVSALPTAATAI